MKKRLLCFITATMITGTFSTTVQAETWYSNATLNIREAPGIDSAKVGRYLRDEEVNVIDYDKDG